MGNSYFSIITDERIENFINSFVVTARKLYIDNNDGALRHSGEYGTYREYACIELLKMFIPTNFGISDGFIINKDDVVSTQCDIIIYDKNKMPSIGINKNKIFLTEAVAGIIEVKSTLDSTKLKQALIKLSKIKSYKLSQTSNKPHSPISDMFTAIICYDYDSSLDNITNYLDNNVYDDTINPRNKHNLILSIKNGLIGYDCLNAKEKYKWLISELEKPNNLDSDIIKKTIQEIGDLENLECKFNNYPTIFDIPLTSQFYNVVSDNRHIKGFLNYLHQMTINSVNNYPDFLEYFKT